MCRGVKGAEGSKGPPRQDKVNKNIHRSITPRFTWPPTMTNCPARVCDFPFQEVEAVNVEPEAARRGGGCRFPVLSPVLSELSVTV